MQTIRTPRQRVSAALCAGRTGRVEPEGVQRRSDVHPEGAKMTPSRGRLVEQSGTKRFRNASRDFTCNVLTMARERTQRRRARVQRVCRARFWQQRRQHPSRTPQAPVTSARRSNPAQASISKSRGCATGAERRERRDAERTRHSDDIRAGGRTAGPRAASRSAPRRALADTFGCVPRLTIHDQQLRCLSAARWCSQALLVGNATSTGAIAAKTSRLRMDSLPALLGFGDGGAMFGVYERAHDRGQPRNWFYSQRAGQRDAQADTIGFA